MTSFEAQLSSAEVRDVDPDPSRAREFLAQAKRFLEDAEGDLSLESAVVLLWNACIAAMDSLLTFEGLRVGSGDGSHALRVATARGAAGSGYSELFDRLDEWRRERADVSYAALTPSAAVVAAMTDDAREIITLSGARVL